MKTLVFLLVLANLLFYAFTTGYFGRPDNPDADRIQHQVAPELMRLVSRGEAPVIKPPPVEEAPAAAPDAAAAAEAPQVSPPLPAPPPNVCLRWNRLAATDADQLSTRLGQKFSTFKLTRKLVAGEGSTWWVYIPPLPDKASVDKKAAELKQFGVGDHFIMQEAGPNHYAISLGVFSSEKGGNERLAELKAKGVKSARLSVRPGKDSLITLEATGPAPDKRALLDLAKATLPNSAAEDCR